MPDCGDKKGGGGSGGDSGKNDGPKYEKLETASPDPRFPFTNVTNHCFTMYNDFHRCQCLLGEEHDPCNYFKRVFTQICPNAWISRWDDMRDRGVYPGRVGPNI